MSNFDYSSLIVALEESLRRKGLLDDYLYTILNVEERFNVDPESFVDLNRDVNIITVGDLLKRLKQEVRTDNVLEYYYDIDPYIFLRSKDTAKGSLNFENYLSCSKKYMIDTRIPFNLEDVEYSISFEKEIVPEKQIRTPGLYNIVYPEPEKLIENKFFRLKMIVKYRRHLED